MANDLEFLASRDVVAKDDPDIAARANSELKAAQKRIKELEDRCLARLSGWMAGTAVIFGFAGYLLRIITE